MTLKTEVNQYPTSTPHLNAHGLLIRSSSTTGRGIYASHSIPRGTVIDVSPVLIFSTEEYLAHGKYTALDSYTFVWKDPNQGGKRSWALALGLGSLFNHSSTPNVSYKIDYRTMSIRYTTCRKIAPDDELFISYGREEDLWWNDPKSKDGAEGGDHEPTSNRDEDDVFLQSFGGLGLDEM